MSFYARGISFLTALMVLVSALPAIAATTDVVIDDFVISKCGQHEIAFSGTANLSSGQTLQVKRDTAVIPHLMVSTTWITSLVTNSPGAHTVTATIFDGSTSIETATRTFVVPVCAGSDGGSSGGGGGGGGSSSSSEPEAKKVVKPRVLGTSAKCVVAADKKKADFIQNKEVPAVVAQLFQNAYNKNISHPESVYWKGRARCDKPTKMKLFGAMLWHAHKGISPVAKVTK